MKPVRSRILRPVAIAVALFAGAIALPVAFGDEPGWKSLAPAPTPRQEVSYVALGGSLYLAGGNDRNQDRYDPATDSWTQVAALPPAFANLDHVNGVALDGRIVYAGGLSSWEYPFPVTDEVAIYDPLTDSFSEGSEMPSPRAAGGVAAWQGKLIYAGGLGPTGSVARVDAYDPQTDEWTQLEDMPRPRDHFQATVVGDELYAIGGRRTFEDEGGLEIEDIAAVDVLDLPAGGNLATGTWRPAVTSLPTPRGGLGVSAVGACLYATGGEITVGDSDSVTGVTESYDTVSGEWRELPPLPIPRHGIQAATVGQTVYVAGGGTESFSSSPTAVSESLDVAGATSCVASATEAGSGAPEPAPGATLGTDRTPRIERLSVRPRRVRLHSGPRRKRGAAIVLFLSDPGRVLLHLRGRFRFSRQLHAGRNTLPLPSHPNGRLLPRGRYRLLATPLPRGESEYAQAAFSVIG
jgi:hypothetical protein